MNESRYWAEREERPGEISVKVVFGDDAHKALADGKAVQFYCMDYTKLKADMAAEFPEADVWYTERNGDPIAMLVPKGTDTKRLPSVAMEYMAFEWIDPDKDFGTGVMPEKMRLRQEARIAKLRQEARIAK